MSSMFILFPLLSLPLSTPFTLHPSQIHDHFSFNYYFIPICVCMYIYAYMCTYSTEPFQCCIYVQVFRDGHLPLNKAIYTYI